MSLTLTGTLPLIPAPAHGWSTLLTVLKQTHYINAVIVGPNKKIGITLDIGLYKPAKQLEMYRGYLQGQFILRLGELHTPMVMLQTTGSYIDTSGLDIILLESDMYGSATRGQILDGNHVYVLIKHTLRLCWLHSSCIRRLLKNVLSFYKHHSNKSQCT